MTTDLKHEAVVLYSSEGDKIRTDVRYIKNGRKKPVLVFLHGFKGFKDWGPFPIVCERFAEQQFVAISFNFSHNGVSDQLTEFTELDRFAHNTVSTELREAHDVLAALLTGQIPIDESEFDPERIGIVGHSRGASLGILAGAHYHEVKAVSAWAPVSKFDRYTPRQKDKWKEEGYLEVMNSRTGQRMRMNASFLDDLEKHHDRLDILKAAHQMTAGGKPLQIISASEDLTAPPREAQEIKQAAGAQHSEIHIIERTGHTFGVEHPFKGMTPAFDTAMAMTIDFFKRSFAHMSAG
ncbi:MAG TPA: alpha/beta fold hydrolase [Candidatus Kapabacteria bacterium]|nr:alpha/beta fold hydrolase [Candidatus Kapabacteria bacterium]